MLPEEKYVTALYGRTSKDDPRRVTIEIQQTTLRDWAARDGMVERIIEEYWDDGVSGKVEMQDRPAGKRLFDDVLLGKIQAVAVLYSDRFGRTLRDGLNAAKLLENAGVKLVAVNDGWDARRNDAPLYFQFRMMMAEEEHRRIAERMSNGKKRAIERDNAPPGGPLVFGYRLGDHGRFVPDPVEAPIVIRMFEMAYQGWSNSAILSWARTTQVRAGRKFQRRADGATPTVVRNHERAGWHLTKIGKILQNRVYIGERRWGNQVFPCVPLVEREVFDKVQEMGQVRSERFGIGKGDPSKGLLSGMFKCAQCGKPFYHKATATKRQNGTTDRYQMYACDGMRRKNGCRAKMLRVDELDSAVWAVIGRYLENPEALVRKVIASDDKLSSELGELRQRETDLADEIAGLEAEVKGVWAEQKAHNWPLAWVAPKLDDLNANREKLTSVLHDVRRKLAVVAVDRDESSAVMAAVATLRAKLKETISPEEKYRFTRMVVAGGSVATIGDGRSKTAEVTVLLKWGERLAYPELPKQW
jgi:site-specific DNA recombinase